MNGSRSDTQPGGACGMEGHSVELLKAKKLFLERKNFRNFAVAFNLISRLKQNHGKKRKLPKSAYCESKSLLAEVEGVV